MALVFADKVKVRAYTTGLGDFTLDAAVPGYQSFAAVGAGNECYYGIEDHAGNWEVGRGTYDIDSTQELLYRDTVISSSNSNNKVNFPAGGKSVFLTLPSSVAANIISSTTYAFRDIAVAGQTTVVADSTADTLTLVAGNEIDITTNATTDTITINADLSAVGQDVLPAINSDGTTGYTLGSPSFQWKELFVSNGSIYIGDVKLSNVGGKLAVTKVINPGEDDEEDDPDDSEADSDIKTVNKLVNGAHEFALTSDGSLTLDGDPFTGGSGSGVDGLTGNTDLTPEDEGDTNYELDINNDIELKTYQDNPEADNNLGPAISLGYDNGGSRRAGVVAIGNDDVGFDSKQGGVYIGAEAGWNDEEDSQGEFAIAIGAYAARNFAQDNSITLNATGEYLNPTAEGLYIKPVRESSNAKALYYNTTTGEVTYNDAGGGATSYTPNETRDWEDPAPTTIAAALDELAARVTALQNFEIDGGNAYTPELGELLIDGNGA